MNARVFWGCWVVARVFRGLLGCFESLGGYYKGVLGLTMVFCGSLGCFGSCYGVLRVFGWLSGCSGVR